MQLKFCLEISDVKIVGGCRFKIFNTQCIRTTKITSFIATKNKNGFVSKSVIPSGTQESMANQENKKELMK